MLNDHLLFNYLVDAGKLRKLNGASSKFFLVLLRHADRHWRCFLRNDTAANETGVCLGHFYRCRLELGKLGILTWATDGRRTFYQLHIPSTEKRNAAAPKGFAEKAIAPKLDQTVRRRENARPPSISVLTSSLNSSAPPAVPAEAAAVLARLRKCNVRPAKAAEWASAYPLPVLLWLCGRIERKKPSNPTGFGDRLLKDEGEERARAAAAELEEQRRRREDQRLAEEAKARERAAIEDLDAMVKRAWESLTPAQRIGLHHRAAAMSPLPASRRKLEKWTDGPPAAVALAILRADLAGRAR